MPNLIGAICDALEVEPNDIMNFIPEIDKQRLEETHAGTIKYRPYRT